MRLSIRTRARQPAMHDRAHTARHCSFNARIFAMSRFSWLARQVFVTGNDPRNDTHITSKLSLVRPKITRRARHPSETMHDSDLPIVLMRASAA